MGVVVTLAGLAKFAAAAAAGGSPVILSTIAVGDGNGAAITPLQTMTGLVNERHRVPVDSRTIDPEHPTWLRVTAEIPGSAGPFWVREIGLFDASGTLIAIADYPETMKAVAAMGVVTALQIQMILVLASTANIQVDINPDGYATREWVIARKVPMAQLTNLPHLPVKSITLTAPPASPLEGDLYAIPAGATGAWAGHAQRLAEWSGTAWTILIPPDGHLIGVPNGTIYKRMAGVYSAVVLTVFASEAEHLAGSSTTRMAHPAGVKAMIDALRAELIEYINGLIVATGNVAAQWGQVIWCDTSAGPITVTLPQPSSQPDVKKRVPIEIYRIGANDVTIARNGQPIAALAENLTIERNRRGVRASYVGTTWRVEGRRVA